jgi:hypothetical protein
VLVVGWFGHRWDTSQVPFFRCIRWFKQGLLVTLHLVVYSGLYWQKTGSIRDTWCWLWFCTRDASQDPVVIIFNSSELRAVGFDLRAVIPLQIEVTTRRGQCTRGVVLKQIHRMGSRRYVLSVDNDNEFRSRCEWIWVRRFGSTI